MWEDRSAAEMGFAGCLYVPRGKGELEVLQGAETCSAKLTSPADRTPSRGQSFEMRGTMVALGTARG